MIHRTYWQRLFALVAVALPAGAVLTHGLASAGEEKSPAAKALENDPALRAKLTTETFKQLKEKLRKAAFNGKTYYFVEGDLKIDEDQLLFFARDLENQLQKFKEVELGVATPDPTLSPLMLHRVNGQVMRWEPGSTLTYCVLRKTFADDQEHQKVVANVKAATAEWAATCNINFRHESGKDDDEPGGVPPAGVTFTVRKVNEAGGPIASSFFPGDPASDRHLLLFPDYFAADLSFDKVGVVRHELGHVLGFRHEHIRSEAPPVCQGEPIGEAIPATKYDPKSVMHYFCGGRGSKELKITLLDRKGSRMVYGASKGAPAGLAAAAETVDAAAGELNVSFKNVKP